MYVFTYTHAYVHLHSDVSTYICTYFPFESARQNKKFHLAKHSRATRETAKSQLKTAAARLGRATCQRLGPKQRTLTQTPVESGEKKNSERCGEQDETCARELRKAL